MQGELPAVCLVMADYAIPLHNPFRCERSYCNHISTHFFYNTCTGCRSFFPGDVGFRFWWRALMQVTMACGAVLNTDISNFEFPTYNWSYIINVYRFCLWCFWITDMSCNFMQWQLHRNWKDTSEKISSHQLTATLYNIKYIALDVEMFHSPLLGLIMLQNGSVHLRWKPWNYFCCCINVSFLEDHLSCLYF